MPPKGTPALSTLSLREGKTLLLFRRTKHAREQLVVNLYSGTHREVQVWLPDPPHERLDHIMAKLPDDVHENDFTDAFKAEVLQGDAPFRFVVRFASAGLHAK